MGSLRKRFRSVGRFFKKKTRKSIQGNTNPIKKANVNKVPKVAGHSLIIPMDIRGIYFDKDTTVAGPTADYSKLPWKKDANNTVNENTPPLGDTIVSEPFSDNDITLKKGIHLHWFLPQIMSAQFPKQENVELPEFWVVARLDDSRKLKLSDAKIISTRYLSPTNGKVNPHRSNIPIPYDLVSNPFRQPFRYLGKTLPFDNFYFNSSPIKGGGQLWGQSDILHPLTGLGFGDPSYFSFYPDSGSVTGFYDDLSWNSSGKATKASYLVMGSFSLPSEYDQNNISRDELFEISKIAGIEWESLKKIFATGSTEEIPEAGNIISKISAAALIEVDLTGTATTPDASNLTFTVGNTITEALSSLIASTNSGGIPADKKKIEETLQSIHLKNQLSTLSTDIGPKFHEKRHQDTFQSIHSGTKVIIKPVKETEKNSNPLNTSDIQLSSEILAKLNKVNTLLEDFDQYLHQISDTKRQTYSDWCKYITLKYSATKDNTKVQKANLILVKQLASLTDLINTTGLLDWDMIRKNNSLPPQPKFLNTKASEIHDTLADLKQLLAAENPKWETLDIQDNSYWLPSEPQVLIDGLGLSPANVGHDQKDGVIALEFADLLELSSNSFEKSMKADNYKAGPEYNALQDMLIGAGDLLRANPGKNKVNEHWNPFVMEWEIEFDPSFTSEDLVANPILLKTQFELLESKNELSPKSKSPGNTTTISGRIFLSPSAGVQQSEMLESYLEGELGENWKTLITTPGSITTTDLVKGVPAFPGLPTVQKIADIYNNTQGKVYLSQSLGGFNEALRMYRTILQPPVVDPLGTKTEISFSEKIETAVGNEARHSPEPENVFLPLRAGSFQVTKLRLIDNWGRYKDAASAELATPLISEALTPVIPNPSNAWADLPPRISQPAKLNFSFLSASKDKNALLFSKNNVNVASPICGWLQSNHLDGTLMVFDADGTAIGSINEELEFFPPPGKQSLPEITNEYLQKVVEQIKTGTTDFFQDFMSITGSALDMISPENGGEKTGISLFMGRPMAVVRCKVSFDLQGLPSVDESWEAFDELIKNYKYDRSEWAEKVFLPVRLGEYRQLNDGLIGFWREENNDRLGPKFFGSVDTLPPSLKTKDVETNHAPDGIQWMNFGKKNYYTLLMDPRAKIHATSGLVPVEYIGLSPDEYTPALKKLYTWFYSGPNLNPTIAQDGKKFRNQVRMKLPKEEGWTWSWMSQTGEGNWVEVAGESLSPPVETAEFNSTNSLREGWLILKQREN